METTKILTKHYVKICFITLKFLLCGDYIYIYIHLVWYLNTHVLHTWSTFSHPSISQHHHYSSFRFDFHFTDSSVCTWCVHVCACVCRGTYTREFLIEIKGWWWMCFSIVPLTFQEKASHWRWGLVFQLDSLTNEVPGSTCLCSGVPGVLCHA